MPDGSGGVIFAWSGASGDGIYAGRLNHAGVVPGWASTGVRLVDGTAGPHALEVAPDAVLTAGVYVLRLTSGRASRSARFVVLR